MEDFRISNFLAHEVEHFGQERAEKGADVSPDGGDSGAAHGESYDFPEAQEQIDQEGPFPAEDDADQDSQDDDTTRVALSELDRVRFLMGSAGLHPELQQLRGQHYYQEAQKDPLREIHIQEAEELADEENSSDQG